MPNRAAATAWWGSQAAAPVVSRRAGIVRADGRNWRDDTGLYYPLGGTLFWALRGWKFDRDRVKANLAYLAKFHFDYYRLLGAVNWAGNDIRPDVWPDYDDVFTGLVDWAYDTLGLRAGLTLCGSGDQEGDPVAYAQRVVGLVHGREHKFQWFEPANESFQNGPTPAVLRAMIATLRSGLPSHVVGSSSEGDWAPDFVAAQRAAVSDWGATMGTTHSDRSTADFGWHMVRQPWDWKDLPFPMSANEPPGPRSSVVELTDSLQLAMLRATGIVCGVGDFVLHNGAGVAGQVDPAHNRPANLWEVPGIDDMMRAVRGVDAGLPNRAGDGQHFNNGWAGNPFVADAIWSDGADHGINRCYLNQIPGGFVQAIDGILEYVIFTAAHRTQVDLFDVIAGKIVRTLTVDANSSVRIEPTSRDASGFGAYIATGRYV